MNSENIKRFLELEVSFNNNKRLRFKGLLKKDAEVGGYEGFLERFFTIYNKNYCTICAETHIQTCGLDRNRSLDDIYSITKYYFPNITLAEVLKWLVNTTITGKPFYLETFKCVDVGKRIYVKTIYKYISDSCDDGHGFTWNNYKEILNDLKI